MQTMLITGFGPFPRVDHNPSGLLARLLDGQEVAGVRFVGLQIDTSWTRAWPALSAAAERLEPDALVMLGVANRDTVEVEIVAHNHCGPIADCDGALPEVGPLIADAPDAIETSLPWQALDSALSADAGRYLCNAVFYRAMHHLTEIPWRGFVHMPHDGAPEAHALILRLARWLAARADPASRAAPSGETACS